MALYRKTAVLVVLLGWSAGCASAPKLPIFGSWRVASYSSPGMSAAASVQSLAWVGTSASFTPKDARVAGNHCYSPTYTPRTLSAAEFQQEFRAAAATLGISADPVTVFKLECGSEWAGQGDTLIVKSDTTLLTPWNGMFLELVKTALAMD